jgi:hypothetical protein
MKFFREKTKGKALIMAENFGIGGAAYLTLYPSLASILL